MKKVIIVFEVLVVFIFIVKLFAIGEIVKRSEISGFPLWSADHALAEPSPQRTDGTLVRDVFEDALANERSLMISLEDRRKQIENRENFVKYEEQKINSLKKEITARMAKLQSLEQNIPAPQESDVKEDKKKFKDLAKAYEATPPEKVGDLFNKMDNKTAATIIMQMNTKKAGILWGHLDPVKAVEIAKTIVSM
jgi:flagellar motility protein MotE (MotC chaperone)